MFTGIVEAVGQLEALFEGERLRRVRIRVASPFLEGVGIGDSISVDGACLTAVAVEKETFEAEIVGATLDRTIAPLYRVGTPLNLERAAPLQGRIQGHLVQGHVDGLGVVVEVRQDGEGHRLRVKVPAEVHRMTLPRGSVTLNGVSLTVAELLGGGLLEVALIPHSWTATNLRYLQAGDRVNVEGDLIGKYVARFLAPESPGAGGAQEDGALRRKEEGGGHAL